MGSLFRSVYLFASFSPVPCYLDYCRFKVSLKVRQYQSSNFVLPNIVLPISCLLPQFVDIYKITLLAIIHYTGPSLVQQKGVGKRGASYNLTFSGPVIITNVSPMAQHFPLVLVILFIATTFSIYFIEDLNIFFLPALRLKSRGDWSGKNDLPSVGENNVSFFPS